MAKDEDKYYLLEVSGNYADEFNVSGREVTDDTSRAEKFKKMNDYDGDHQHYFGSNEGVEIRDLDFKVSEISKNQYDVLDSFDISGILSTSSLIWALDDDDL